MTRQKPLHLRLYFDPSLAEVVRLLGYDGLPVPAARERLAALVERLGKEKVNAAVKELVEIDPSSEPPLARLKSSSYDR